MNLIGNGLLRPACPLGAEGRGRDCHQGEGDGGPVEMTSLSLLLRNVGRGPFVGDLLTRAGPLTALPLSGPGSSVHDLFRRLSREFLMPGRWKPFLRYH